MSAVTSSHILVVNDFPDVLAFFRDLLEDEGYRVSIRTVVASDVSTVGLLAPDVVVLDAMWLTAPDWALLQGLTTGSRTRAIPVVLCTALMHTSAIPVRLNGLTVRVVNKPYTLDELLNEIHATLDNAKLVA